MEVLLTIEEYKERAINLVMDVAKNLINPTADDWFKFETIMKFAGETFTNHYMLIEQENQLFIKCFCFDRNGKRLNSTNIKKIGRKEADEFNSQDWYKSEYEKAKKDWDLARCWSLKISPYKYMGNNTFERIVTIEDVVSKPFEDSNEAYYVAVECFKRLYGYEYHNNREFKVK